MDIISSDGDFRNLDALLREYDRTSMPMPSLEAEPQLLISKVRKSYLDYVIKLLTANYETHQKLLGKNIYLPSAIWRCAKYLEINAAQSCMVIELYRKNILDVIKQLKADTNRGKLHKKLFECLQKPPDNEKKMQVNLDLSKTCNCRCSCAVGIDKKRRKLPQRSTKKVLTDHNTSHISCNSNNCETPMDIKKGGSNIFKIPVIVNAENASPILISVPQEKPVLEIDNSKSAPNITPVPAMPIELQDSEDQVMLQLEQLFRTDCNDAEDDLFEGTFYGELNSIVSDAQVTMKALTNDNNKNEVQSAELISLDQRLALLESTGILNLSKTKEDDKASRINESPKSRRQSNKKWLCEEYFQKQYYFEKMDQIKDSNRSKHSRIKHKLTGLFGADSDDEQIMSPLDETPEFIFSCKERIAPWIVKLLTPYYVQGRIKGKTLFKSLAKYLISLIYQCSKYPSEYEVHSFVSDFLNQHKLIRCQADFQDFRIENI